MRDDHSSEQLIEHFKGRFRVCLAGHARAPQPSTEWEWTGFVCPHCKGTNRIRYERVLKNPRDQP